VTIKHHLGRFRALYPDSYEIGAGIVSQALNAWRFAACRGPMGSQQLCEGLCLAPLPWLREVPLLGKPLTAARNANGVLLLFGECVRSVSRMGV